MKVNASVFDEYPFILSANDSYGSAKLIKIKILRDVRYELESEKFVPMESRRIAIDDELALKVSCRVGTSDILIMPWYTSTLNKEEEYWMR